MYPCSATLLSMVVEVVVRSTVDLKVVFIHYMRMSIIYGRDSARMGGQNQVAKALGIGSKSSGSYSRRSTIRSNRL